MGWLTALYDPAIAWTTRERRFKNALIAQTSLFPGARVLDLGSGTGTLVIWCKQREPRAEFVGVDGDAEVLRRACRKAAAAGVSVRFDRAFSHALPYRDESFDRVTSSLFFHHLGPQAKRKTLREVFRVLRPGGELHVADFGKAANRFARWRFYPVQLLDGFENTEENLAGRLPACFVAAGFDDVEAREEIGTLFGTLVLYRARRPAGAR